MALPGYMVLAQAIYDIPRTTSKINGVTNLVNAIGDYMDQMQADGGSPTIFKLNRPAMIGILMQQHPVANNSWVIRFANGWEAGVNGAQITPGTVPNGAWSDSGGKDTETKSIGSGAILNVGAGKSVLITNLYKVIPTIRLPIEMALAVHLATLTLMYENIGLKDKSPFPIPAKAS